MNKHKQDLEKQAAKMMVFVLVMMAVIGLSLFIGSNLGTVPNPESASLFRNLMVAFVVTMLFLAGCVMWRYGTKQNSIDKVQGILDRLSGLSEEDAEAEFANIEDEALAEKVATQIALREDKEKSR